MMVIHLLVTSEIEELLISGTLHSDLVLNRQNERAMRVSFLICLERKTVYWSPQPGEQTNEWCVWPCGKVAWR